MTLLDAITLHDPTVTTSAQRQCCCYAQAVIERWAMLPPATGSLLAMWRIFPELENPWSPVEAVQAVGLGEQVAAPIVGRWHLVQGWRTAGDPERVARGETPQGTGHTFLWRASSAEWGRQCDSADPRGPDNSSRRWADVVAEFRGGLAIAVLRRPRDGSEG